MIDTILAKVHHAWTRSELLRAVAQSRQHDGRALTTDDASLRPLTDREVASLERQGNTADDWSLVRVAEGFDFRRIRDSSFHGSVTLGRFNGRVSIAGVDLPAGIYRSQLMDCAIGHGALVSDVRLLANSLVGSGAVLVDCGRVVCNTITAFGNGQRLPLGLEGGGRDVPIYAEIDVQVAAAVASRRRSQQFQQDYAELVGAYTAAVKGTQNIICAHSLICHTPRLENVYVGPYARIDGATQVVDSTILSAHREETTIESGASVTRSILQWGSRVATMAIVDRSVLTEHSGAERQGKVTDSLLGPNTVVGQGEVTASLLGPLVGFHHQALLIAAFWPEGKGNVAAGACIGSNHTGRAPDQEFRPGEGTFLGLGINVKYPADLSRSPYTIVACGVTLPPQAVAFPFSLIMPPKEPTTPPGLNQIIPGWLLTDSMYSLARHEAKFRVRNRAQRVHLETEIFRPELIDLVAEACTRLESRREHKEFYTGADIPGLGKNYVLESHVNRAIAGYRLAIRHYALRALLARTQELISAGRTSTVLRVLDLPTGTRWEHSRRLLRQSCDVTDVRDGLLELRDLAQQIAEAVERSKAKDDERGTQVFSDYADAHPPANEDPIVRQTWSDARSLTDTVTRIIGLLGRRTLNVRSKSPAVKSPVPVG